MPVPLSQEFQLAAACCIWPPSSARQDAVRALAGEDLDWAAFVGVVGRQRVAGMVQDGLARAGVVPPDPYRQQIAEPAAEIAKANLRFAAESLRLQLELDSLGVAPVFIKGVALAQHAFGGLSLRHSKDIDVLVAEGCAMAAVAALEAGGYRRLFPSPELAGDRLGHFLSFSKDCELRHLQTGLQVEVHERLLPNRNLLDKAVAGQLQTVVLSKGYALSTLADEPLFAYLCAHGAAHGWSRLKWLADIGALMSRAGGPNMTEFYQAAKKLGAGRCAGQALLLYARIFGASIPPELEKELGSDPSLRWLLHIGLEAMAGGGVVEIENRPCMARKIMASQFLLGRGWKYHWGQVAALGLNPEDLIVLPLPRRLFFLYPVLRLPLWIWRHAARASRSLS